MRRTATEIINDLEVRIAKLERESFRVGDQQATAPWDPKAMFREIAMSFPSLPRSQAYHGNGRTRIIVSDIRKHSAEINIAGPTYGVAKKIMKKIGKLFAKYGFEMVDESRLQLNDGSGYEYKINIYSMRSISLYNVETVKLY